MTEPSKKRGKHKQLKMTGSSGVKKGKFSLNILLITNKQIYCVNNVYNDMKIIQFKALIELITGLPSDIQRLYYLDDGDLVDNSDIKSNDIVPGSTITMSVWSEWTTLVEAIAANDIAQVLELGVTQDGTYTSPNLEYMSYLARRSYISHRAVVALIFAAHRGNKDILQMLIDAVTNLNAVTPHGRTALHLVSAQGNGAIVDLLMANGIDVDIVDNSGNTALMIADQFHHKACGRHLFLFQWQQRAKNVKPQMDIPLMDHQYHDSARKLGFIGVSAQRYRLKVSKPGEYDSTALNAKKHDPFSNSIFRKKYKLCLEGGEGRLSPGSNVSSSRVILPPLPKTFDQWVKNKNKAERRRITVIRSNKEREMIVEEDKKLTEQHKSESYDNWLKYQQQQLTFENKTPGPSPTPSQQIRTKGYLREYLESLLEHKRNAITSNNWVVLKGIDMLNSVEERPPLKQSPWAMET